MVDFYIFLRMYTLKVILSVRIKDKKNFKVVYIISEILDTDCKLERVNFIDETPPNESMKNYMVFGSGVSGDIYKLVSSIGTSSKDWALIGLKRSLSEHETIVLIEFNSGVYAGVKMPEITYSNDNRFYTMVKDLINKNFYFESDQFNQLCNDGNPKNIDLIFSTKNDGYDGQLTAAVVSALNLGNTRIESRDNIYKDILLNPSKVCAFTINHYVV